MSRRWRLLAHGTEGPIELENQGSFDEIVVGNWLHVEQLDDSSWWLRVGDARILVELSGDDATRVNVERGFYGPTHGDTKE